MGTNYYVATNHCECCDRYDEEFHIGKSSVGWAFSFRGYPTFELESWKQWKEFLKDKIIKDEYGDTITYQDFVDLIETVKAPGYINPQTGRKNQQLNEAIKKDKYFSFDSEYSFTCYVCGLRDDYLAEDRAYGSHHAIG